MLKPAKTKDGKKKGKKQVTFSLEENPEENIYAEIFMQNASPDYTPIKQYIAATMPNEATRGYKSADEISEHDVFEKEHEEVLSLTDAYR